MYPDPKFSDGGGEGGEIGTLQEVSVQGATTDKKIIVGELAVYNQEPALSDIATDDLTYLNASSDNNPMLVDFNIGAVRHINVNPSPENGQPNNPVIIMGTNVDNRGNKINDLLASWVFRLEHNFQRVAYEGNMQGEFGLDFSSPASYAKAWRLFAIEPEFTGGGIRTYFTLTEMIFKDVLGLAMATFSRAGLVLTGDITAPPHININGAIAENALHPVLLYNGKTMIGANVTAGGVSNTCYIGEGFTTTNIRATNVALTGALFEVTGISLHYNHIRTWNYAKLQIQNADGNTFTEYGNGKIENLQNQVLQLNPAGQGVCFSKMTKTQRDVITPANGTFVYVTDNGGYLSWYQDGWQKVSSVAD